MKCQNCGKKTTAPYCSKECLLTRENNFILQEMKHCDQCQNLKMEAIIPAVCQHHLDMQFNEVTE